MKIIQDKDNPNMHIVKGAYLGKYSGGVVLDPTAEETRQNHEDKRQKEGIVQRLFRMIGKK